jgi:hypothetical protein
MLKIVNPEIKRMEAMRCARSLGPSLSSEVENVRNKLRGANQASEEALEYMEKWSRRERDALDYGETMRQQEQVLLCMPVSLQCCYLTGFRIVYARMLACCSCRAFTR